MFNPFENPAFMLYMMEQEGELDTYEGKINKAIKYLAHSSDPTDECELYAALDYAGLRPGDVSQYDINRIQKEAARK